MKFHSCGIDVKIMQLLQNKCIDPGDSVFNPSFLETKKGQYLLSLRKISASTKKRSQLLISLGIGENMEICLQSTHEFETLGGHSVRDLKLFSGPDGAFATFNTGHPGSLSRTNKVFISRVNEIESPREVHLSGRNRVEKNWGFFFEENRLKAVYSINPVVVIEEEWSSSDGIWMKEAYRAEEVLSGSELSIGSQPHFHDGSLVFTAHRKPSFMKFRYYLPLLSSLELSTMKLKMEKIRLPAKRPFSSWSKWNRFGLSVNYASGLLLSDSRLYLGLGIGDHSFQLGTLNPVSVDR